MRGGPPCCVDAVRLWDCRGPAWAVSGIFMDPDERYAHGLNERVPVKAFYDALDHWSIIIRELAGPKD